MPNLTSGREFVDTLRITPSEFATLLAAGMPHWKIPGGDNYTQGVFLDTEVVYVWLRTQSTYRQGEWAKLEEAAEKQQTLPFKDTAQAFPDHQE